jgi:hypothetical protein
MSEIYGASASQKGRFTHNALVFIITGLCLGIIIYMAIPKTWEEAVTQKEDGSYGLSKTWDKTVTRKVEKIRKHRLYALVATNNGYFECAHSPTGRFYLNRDEVYRYGTTGSSFSKRGYSQDWLAKHNLTLFRLMDGDLTTVLARQTTLIGSYPLLPENMSRPLPGDNKATPSWFRLVLPPGNKSLD